MVTGNLGIQQPSAKLDLIEGDFEPGDFDAASIDKVNVSGLEELKGNIEGMVQEMRVHFRRQEATLATLVHGKGFTRQTTPRQPFTQSAHPQDGPTQDGESNHVKSALMHHLAGFPDSFLNPREDEIAPQESNQNWRERRKSRIKVKKDFVDSLEAETLNHNAKADMKRSQSLSEGSSLTKSEEQTLSRCPSVPSPTRPCKFLRWLIFQRSFESFVMSLILVNVVIVGVEVDMSARLPSNEIPMLFITLDRVFTVIFLLELMLKLCVLSCSEFFGGPDRTWNIFDLLIISISVIEMFLSVFSSLGKLISASHLRMLRVLRLARAFRGIRAMRLLRFIASLRTLMYSIVNTLRSLAWTVLLLVMIFYIFGVAFTQAISDHCRDEAIGVTGDVNAVPQCSSQTINAQWLSLPRSMLTLFKSATNGIAWGDVADPLFEVSFFLVVVFIIYFAFTFFAVLNVVTGVFCHTAIESANSDKDIAIRVQLNQQQSYVRAIKGMFRDIDADGSNSITIDEFERTLDDERMKAYLASIDVDTVDAWTLFSLIDKDMSGCIDVEEFVTGCLNLRGSAKALHIAKMSYENKHTRQMMKSLLESSASLHEHLDALTSRLDLPELERTEIAAANPALQIVPAQ